MARSLPIIAGLVVCALASTCLRAAAPILNELHYHPPGTNVLEEWIELHNPGSTPLPLSGWRIDRGVSFTFPAGTSIPPQGFLVVAAHLPTFAARHPDVTNAVGGWTGSLSDGGENLRLSDPTGTNQVSLHYATEGDWATRRLAAPDRYGKVGWEWSALHDGGGSTLELVNPALPIEHGQNWASSTVSGGTPGQPNSTHSKDAAPLILGARHLPSVPGSDQPVTISARLLDESKVGLSAQVHWRTTSSLPFQAVALLDDGQHGDGLANDGLFAAVLPPQANGTVVEFYLSAMDAGGHSRTIPRVEPTAEKRSPWFVYQVDDSIYDGTQPLYRLVATAEERTYLEKEVWLGSQLSDARVNGTFIASDSLISDEGTPQVRYFASFRNRGHGTRYSWPHNFRVEFANDQRWRQRTALNLNSQFTPIQTLGSAVFRSLAVPIAESVRAQVRWNSINLAATNSPQWGGYAANEAVDSDLAARMVPQDPDGNLYQGVRDFNTAITPNLAWHGSTPDGYTNAYFKQNNTLANDWSDLIHLIDVLNNTPSAAYAEAVRDVVDVPEWMRYFAIHAFLDNQETALGTGVGDDFVLYFPLLDRRAQVWSYDMDSLLGSGAASVASTSSIFRAANLPVISRFLKHPEFAPEFHRQLQLLANGFFNPPQFDAFLDGWALQMQGMPGLDDLLRNLKAYNASRVAFIRSQLPTRLAITSLPGTNSGFPRSTSSTTTVGGTADAARTASVLVNGHDASYSAWEGTWSASGVALRPGINRVLVQALASDGTELSRQVANVWYDDGSLSTHGGTIASSTTWSAAAGPFQVSSSIVIPSGVTLRIEAGASVYLGAGVNITVNDGGQLIAEGTATAPIWIGRAPGATTSWGGITINGSANSPESRIAHAHVEGNGSTAIHSNAGTVFLDHLTFGTTDQQYVSLDGSSFVVSHCHFPAPSATLEPLHGTGGIKANGYGIFMNNFVGSPQGYSDSFDFSGGNRPGQPILHVLGNVFAGSGDDGLDLDGTDAWIEGNIFIGIHRNGAPDSSAAVSGGNGGGATSEITIINNLFFDNDNAATSKQGNFYTLLHNTIVRTTREGGVDFASGIVNLRDTTPDTTTYGRGTYLEGNIITDAEILIRNPLDSLPMTFVNNLLPSAWSGAGSGNRVLDAQLAHIPTVLEAKFNSWEAAQVMRTWLAPRPGSPAFQAGIQGRNLGALQPIGAFVSGEPLGTTASTSATLLVGPLRTGNGIPTDGFPLGSGYVAYRWRLDGGAWSAETPITNPIQLTGLPAGSHFVEVSGKRDSGLYQDDPVFGPLAVTSRSRTWIVDPGFVTPPELPPLRLNEILAANRNSFTNAAGSPDLVELLNTGDRSIDLGGISVSDSYSSPRKFTFAPGTMLQAGAFLVLLADTATNEPGLHLGFSLKASGDNLVLTDAATRGGKPLDSVAFGLQLTDRSIGRGFDGSWTLCQPSFGSENKPIPTAAPWRLRINEWLASARFTSRNDFVELYNPEGAPVELSGLLLSDATTQPDRFAIAPLSYIEAGGYARFIADSDPGQGSDHLSFRLSPEWGLIRLGQSNGETIDVISYGSQRTDASQGRSPDGGAFLLEFSSPTPGGPNPGSGRVECVQAVESRTLLSLNATWSYQQTSSLDGVAWQTAAFNDASWPVGLGLLGVEDCNCLPSPGLRTHLTLGRNTYYFRSRFSVDTNLSGFRVSLTTIVDDGALIYLNGVLVAAPGMTTNGVTYATKASRNQDNAAAEFFTIPASLFVPGTNVIAVEVHQTSSASSDIVWGASIEASRTYTNCTQTITSPVRLNELLARNVSRTNDSGVASDWVELYNPATHATSLAGMSLTDDPASPRQWIFPDTATIPAGGFFVIHCNPLLPPADRNAPIALNGSGGSVFLFDSPLRGGTLLDSVRYGFQAADFAIGRIPDGAATWQLAMPTESAPNKPSRLGTPTAIRVNEWMADPASGDDWFELINTDPLPVALGGLFLTDSLDSPFNSPIPALSFIGTGTGAYRQFFADGKPENGANHTGFNLRRAGEAIGVFAITGQMLDGVTFGAQATGVSQGRFPDAAATFQNFPGTATPGSPNSIITVTDADGDGLPDSWERSFGLDPTNPADATLDPDNDGASNLSEFRAGTNPRNSSDVLAVTLIDSGGYHLSFTVVPGRTYSVEFQDELSPAGWIRVMSIPAATSPGQVSVPIRSDTSQRFFRIVTPAVP